MASGEYIVDPDGPSRGRFARQDTATYMLMMYVTVEQEEVIQRTFVERGWRYDGEGFISKRNLGPEFQLPAATSHLVKQSEGPPRMLLPTPEPRRTLCPTQETPKPLLPIPVWLHQNRPVGLDQQSQLLPSGQSDFHAGHSSMDDTRSGQQEASNYQLKYERGPTECNQDYMSGNNSHRGQIKKPMMKQDHFHGPCLRSSSYVPPPNLTHNVNTQSDDFSSGSSLGQAFPLLTSGSAPFNQTSAPFNPYPASTPFYPNQTAAPFNPNPASLSVVDNAESPAVVGTSSHFNPDPSSLSAVDKAKSPEVVGTSSHFNPNPASLLDIPISRLSGPAAFNPNPKTLQNVKVSENFCPVRNLRSRRGRDVREEPGSSSSSAQESGLNPKAFRTESRGRARLRGKGRVGLNQTQKDTTTVMDVSMSEVDTPSLLQDSVEVHVKDEPEEMHNVQLDSGDDGGGEGFGVKDYELVTDNVEAGVVAENVSQEDLNNITTELRKQGIKVFLHENSCKNSGILVTKGSNQDHRQGRARGKGKGCPLSAAERQQRYRESIKNDPEKYESFTDKMDNAKDSDDVNNLCGTCGKSFKGKSALIQHERRHEGIGPYKCSTCNKVSFSKSNHNRHMQTHTRERTMKCTTCHQMFFNKRDLLRHQRRKKRLFKYVCLHCHMQFEEKRQLKDHEGTHNGEKIYFCSICNKNFRFLSNLNRHKKTHEATLEECGICQKKLKSKETLKKHLKLHDH